MNAYYYDREGRPLSLLDWAKAMEDDTERVVEQTTLPNGVMVSTVWLGLNFQTGDGPPLIFETMVFPDNDCARYATEAEARAGHTRMVDKWTTAP